MLLHGSMALRDGKTCVPTELLHSGAPLPSTWWRSGPSQSMPAPARLVERQMAWVGWCGEEKVVGDGGEWKGKGTKRRGVQGVAKKAKGEK